MCFFFLSAVPQESNMANSLSSAPFQGPLCKAAMLLWEPKERPWFRELRTRIAAWISSSECWSFRLHLKDHGT